MLRACGAVALALAAATCRDALDPGTPTRARIAVAPILPSEAALADFGLTIDAVRFIVVRPAADTLADTTLVLPPDSNELALDLRVAVVSLPETLQVSVVALSGTLPLFSGTRLVPVPSTLATPIPVDSFIGPVADSIAIIPRAPFIALNDSLRFQVQGFNGGVPVTQFYVAWSSSDSALAPINRFGVLRAPGARAAVRIRARTPLGASDSVTATFTPPATQLVAIAGAAQTDTVGTPLVTPLEVQARAADALGVGGVPVRFRAASGDGLVADTLVMTDSAGHARTVATLGGAIGAQSFEASVVGLSGSPVTFSATALAGPPTQLLASGGDAQVTTVATSVPIKPAVVVKDAGGNPVAGVSVTFSVASGGGGVTGGSQTTDASGRATVGNWTLGTLAGTNTLSAAAAGLTRTFTATGVADSASQLIRAAGDLQSALVGTAVATDPTVRAQDQFGNAVAGASITFTVTGGGGSVSGAVQLTNAAGMATLGGWTLGNGVGPNALQASLPGVAPVTFTATGIAGAATAIVKLAGDLQSGIVNAGVATAPRVKLVDQFGNPVAGAGVSFAVSSGGGVVGGASQTTDTGGVATVGSWTLGTATGPNGLTASAGLLSATFNATALSDAPAQLARLVGDGQTAAVGSVLPTPPAVIVRDQFNNPVSGVVVTFAASGNGSVTGASPTTDTSGVATVGTWTLGTLAGATTLLASAGPLSVTFSATALADVAAQIVSQAGDLQTAVVVNSAVPVAPTVKVTDQYGNPVAGVAVTFTVATGGGGVTGGSQTTGGGGLATVAEWTLGPIVGANTLTAAAPGLTGTPVTFTAGSVAAAASQIVTLTGDGQTAIVGDPVLTAPAVKVTDAFGNAVAGVTVTFTVASGGGSLGGSSGVSTDAGGIAASPPWTLGTVVGSNTLTATATGLAGSPVTFSATGLVGTASQMIAFAGDGQSALAGQLVPTPPSVKVMDAFGNAVAGVPVTFTVSAGLGSVNPPTAVTTDGAGVGALTSWTLGIAAGSNTLDATATGLPTVTFTAEGLASAATQMALSAGGGQTGLVGTALGTPYAVLVRDALNNPVAGVPVAWSATSGGGSITPQSTTDASGIAVATRTLGTGAGTQTAAASVGGLTGSPVSFTASALADAASQVVKVAGDGLSGTVNALVPTAPQVRVTDQYGNPVSGVAVTFAVTSGGGLLTGASQSTDAAGLATVGSWRLGTIAGANTLTATAAGVASPATFTVTGLAGAATALALNDGDGQSAIVNALVATRPSVRAADQFGNPVAGVAVTFAGGSGGGAISGANQTTNASGIAMVGSWRLGTVAGANALTATAAGLIGSPVGFTATGLAAAPSQIAAFAGDAQSAVVFTAVPVAPQARVRDDFGNAVAGVAVTFAVTSGGGSLAGAGGVTTDVAGIATSPAWRLGTAAGSNGLNASAAGLTGSPVAFTATGLAGAVTQMVVSAGDGLNAVVGTAVSTNPAVVLKDQFNNLVPNVPVTFLVTSGGGSATGTGALSNAQGVAIVGSWTVGNIAGLNTLRASATGVTPATFTATGLAGAPAQLAFVALPSRSLAGDTLEPPVRVAIQDQFGNTVLPVTDFVHLDIGAIPTLGAKLVGTVDVAAVNGVAEFPDLAIDSAGIGYTLLAATPKIAGRTESDGFDVGGVIGAFPDDRLHPVAAAFNPANGFVYVPGGDGETQTLGVLDPGKGPITLLPILETQPFGVAVNAQTNRIYVTTFAVLTGAVAVIDGQDNVPIGLIPLADTARGIAVDESTDRAFVAVAGDPLKGDRPALAIIDGKENRLITTIPFPEGAVAGIGVAFNPNDRLVYVAIPNVGIGIFDPEKAEFVGAISLVGKGAPETYGVAVDVRTNLLFATNRAENTVSVIDLVGREELTRLQVGREPEGLGVDGERGAVYVGNSGENTVSFIDIGKLEVIATLIVGPAPKAAALDATTGRFYVPTFTDSRVRVVQP
jgi:adhesin/invasin